MGIMKFAFPTTITMKIFEGISSKSLTHCSAMMAILSSTCILFWTIKRNLRTHLLLRMLQNQGLYYVHPHIALYKSTISYLRNKRCFRVGKGLHKPRKSLRKLESRWVQTRDRGFAPARGLHNHVQTRKTSFIPFLK